MSTEIGTTTNASIGQTTALRRPTTRPASRASTGRSMSKPSRTAARNHSATAGRHRHGQRADRRPAAGRAGPRPAERRSLGAAHRPAVPVGSVGDAGTQASSEPPGASSRSPPSRPAAASSARKRWAGSRASRGAAQPDRAERAPVDGHHELGADQLGRPGRGGRVEVALAERRAPAPDRQQGDVDRRPRAHLVEQVGVAGEVDGAAPADRTT